MEMLADDAFWAARRVAAFDDEQIRAIVRTGGFSDPAAERHLADILIQRRAKIARTYLPAVNPLVNPALGAGGELTFEDAAAAAGVAAAPAAYHVVWSRFDNSTGAAQRIGESRGAAGTLRAPSSSFEIGTFVEAEVSAESGGWQQPVRLHFRRTSGGWTLVGLDRGIGRDTPADASEAQRRTR
jgi:hypothetical protein